MVVIFLVEVVDGRSCRLIKSNKPPCFLSFSKIDLTMLISCCLINISIIILRKFLYLVHLSACVSPGLFLSNLCDLISLSIFVFIIINHINSFKQICFFCNMLYYFWMIMWMKIKNNFFNRKGSAPVCYLSFAWCFANFILVFLILVLL